MALWRVLIGSLIVLVTLAVAMSYKLAMVPLLFIWGVLAYCRTLDAARWVSLRR